MKKNYLLLVIILIVAIASLLFWRFLSPEDTWLCADGVWVAQGNPNTPQPTSGCGDDLVNLPSDIEIYSLTPNSEISSPLIITGQARGGWYFEATFPIQLTTVHGLVLGNTYAQAQGDWMTENFVPFSATLDFTLPVDIDQGEIIFEKANPSGLPEHGVEYRIPIKFKVN